MKFILLAAVLVLGSACSSAPGVLTDDGKEVNTLDNKPGSECNVVGKVMGENAQGSPELARNHARNLTAKLHGNAMFITQEVPNGGKIQVFATAYACE